MNVRETVFEYWPELSRSWHSATAAIRHYSMKGGSEALEDEVRAANIVRGLKGDRPVDTTPQDESWRKAGMAAKEIRELGDIGHSIEEIQELTRATVKYVTGDNEVWSEGSIMRQLSHDAPARLNQDMPDRKLYRTHRTPAQERRVQEAHSRERARA